MNRIINYLIWVSLRGGALALPALTRGRSLPPWRCQRTIALEGTVDQTYKAGIPSS